MSWIKVKDYDGRYKVNHFGFVKNTQTNKVITFNTTTTNLRRVALYDGKKTVHHMVHKLVFTHFIGEIPDNHYVYHVDGNSTNNRIENLNLREGKKKRERHSTRRFPIEVKSAILKDIDDGVKNQLILDNYSLSVSYLYKIKKGYWDKYRIDYVKR